VKKYTLLLVIILAVFSCRKNDIANIPPSQSDTIIRHSDTLLVANAGSDKFIWLPDSVVTFDASQSRCFPYDSMRYEWKLISGPSKPEIADSHAMRTVVKGFVFGTYTFELTVTISGGRFAKDRLEVGVAATFPQTGNSCVIPGATHLTDFSEGRADMESIVFNNKFYYVSGDHIDIYNPVTNTITNDSLSLLRGSTALTSNGVKLFIAGGLKYSSGSESRVDIFDASSNVWSRAELSQARSGIAASSIGDKVFFAGGMKDVYAASSRVDIYDVKTNTWSTRELEVAGIYLHAIIGNVLWFMAGDHVEKYDPEENKWTTGKLGIKLPSFSNKAIELDNKIYITGATEVPVYDIPSGSWSSFTLKENLILAPAIACNHKLVFIGGMTSWFVYSTTMEIYDPVSRSISLLKMDGDLYYESLLTYDNYIYSAGGMTNQENTRLSGICRLRPN